MALLELAALYGMASHGHFIEKQIHFVVSILNSNAIASHLVGTLKCTLCQRHKISFALQCLCPSEALEAMTLAKLRDVMAWPSFAEGTTKGD